MINAGPVFLKPIIEPTVKNHGVPSTYSEERKSEKLGIFNRKYLGLSKS